MKKKPLYFYIFKPKITKLKVKHKFNVFKMTCFTIKEIFKKKFSYKNLDNAVTVMGCIFAAILSKKNKLFHSLRKNFIININFA